MIFIFQMKRQTENEFHSIFFIYVFPRISLSIEVVGETLSQCVLLLVHNFRHIINLELQENNQVQLYLLPKYLKIIF